MTFYLLENYFNNGTKKCLRIFWFDWICQNRASEANLQSLQHVIQKVKQATNTCSVRARKNKTF